MGCFWDLGARRGRTRFPTLHGAYTHELGRIKMFIDTKRWDISGPKLIPLSLSARYYSKLNIFPSWPSNGRKSHWWLRLYCSISLFQSGMWIRIFCESGSSCFSQWGSRTELGFIALNFQGCGFILIRTLCI